MIDRDTAIKNETLTGPFAGVIWYILEIFENAALQVIDLVEPHILHQRAGLLAADAAGAVEVHGVGRAQRRPRRD